MRKSKRTPLAEYPAERIALVKPSALGDIVHSLPVLHALRHRYPRVHITWIVNRSYEPLLQGHPDLDATLAVDRDAFRPGLLKGLATVAGFLQDIRRQHFDLVVDLQGLLRTGLMMLVSGAERKVGLCSAREGASWFYTDLLGPPPRATNPAGAIKADFHAVDRYWQVAEALGVGHLPKRFLIPIPDADQQWAALRLGPWPRPWMMMNVGTRWETKRWPAAFFADLAQRALRRYGGTVVLVGGSDEVSLAKGVTSALPHQSFDLTGKTSLPQLAAILSQADVVVSNDSGPLHLAVALGRPVVAPFTCTSPLRTGPYHGREGAVATKVWCAASYRKRCARMDCMKELTPDRLWPALEATLESWEKRSA
jgi:lipopolysaccharide heptosyltransferase II